MTRTITLGVVADTHVPDRMRALPPALWDALAGVEAILHAGDIVVPRVLTELERVAPVYAVAGNRDVFLRLPLDRVLTFEGVRIGLTHGHGGWRQYLPTRLNAYLTGQSRTMSAARRRQFLQAVRGRFDAVQAVVFGHSHRPVNEVQAGVLLFNPGSLGPDYWSPYGPAIGRLTISGGTISGTIIPISIPGAVIRPDRLA